LGGSQRVFMGKAVPRKSKDFLTGGILAFGLSTATVIALDFAAEFLSIPSDLFLLRLFEGLLVFIPMAALASFMVTRRMRRGHMVEALKTGYFGFVMNLVVMLYNQTFFGLLWVFIGYTMGSVLGGAMGKISSGRTIQTEPVGAQ